MFNALSCKRIISLLILYFWMGFSLSAQEPLQYVTYPTPTFTKIEKICNEICIDLQAIFYNNELHEKWVAKSDYLFNQFLILSNSLQLLLNNPEEMQAYLIEDIDYLKSAFDTVELHFKTVYGNYQDMPLITMHTILAECKNSFTTLFAHNKEVIL